MKRKEMERELEGILEELDLYHIHTTEAKKEILRLFKKYKGGGDNEKSMDR